MLPGDDDEDTNIGSSDTEDSSESASEMPSIPEKPEGPPNEEFRTFIIIEDKPEASENDG